MLSLAPALARVPLGLNAFAQGALRLGKSLLGSAQLLCRLDGFGIELGKPVLLSQALRRGRRCVGTRNKPVPAPESSLAAHQPLAGRKQTLQHLAVGTVDDTDLGEAPRKLSRGPNDRRQGHDTRGQLRIARLRG